MPSEYIRITTAAQLKKALRGAGRYCALDFETTALDPAYGRVRLVSLCSATLSCVVDFDRIRGGFAAVAHLFETDTTWIVFNSMFENLWFYYVNAAPKVFDVRFCRNAVLGGGTLSLKNMAKWDLDIDIDKEEQASDWSRKKLTEEQWDYAFADAEVTWQLYMYWMRKMNLRQIESANMFNGMVPAVIEMEESGMRLDVSAHAALIGKWKEIAERSVTRIRALVSEDEVPNLNSQHQWNDFLLTLLEGKDSLLRAWPKTEKTGMLSTTKEALSIVAAYVREPWPLLAELCDALSDYKKIEKYLSSFGETLITKAQLSDDGRVRARFNIAAAKTGRFSSSGPNLQQIPRNQADFLGIEDMSIRRSFIAGRGRRLVSLDYSGIELRVLALLSEDEQLLEDVVFGDLHSEVASFGAGHRIDKSTPEGKALRTAAKAVSFGIIYGSGATGLAGTMKTTPDKAADYIEFWADRYPKAFALRDDMMDAALKSKHLPCVDGGTIYMGAKPDLPKCANYPVQRAALSVMARAIIRHKETLDTFRHGHGPTTVRMLSTIHDALIDEAINRHADQILQLMEHDMIEGYLDIFPGAPTDNLVEGGAGNNWGDLG